MGTVRGPIAIRNRNDKLEIGHCERARAPRIGSVSVVCNLPMYSYHAMALKSSQKTSRMALKKQPYLS